MPGRGASVPAATRRARGSRCMAGQGTACRAARGARGRVELEGRGWAGLGVEGCGARARGRRLEVRRSRACARVSLRGSAVPARYIRARAYVRATRGGARGARSRACARGGGWRCARVGASSSRCGRACSSSSGCGSRCGACSSSRASGRGVRRAHARTRVGVRGGAVRLPAARGMVAAARGARQGLPCAVWRCCGRGCRPPAAAVSPVSGRFGVP